MNLRKGLGVLSFMCITLLCFSAGCADEAERTRPAQYKALHRNAISQIVDGRYDSAIKVFEDYLEEHPGDRESLYGLAIAYTQKSEIDKALGYVEQAVDAGLPFGRFLAGPRSLLKLLTDTAEFQELAKKHAVELLHGPILGCVTDSGAKFWVRTANEALVQVFVSTSEKMDPPIKSVIAKTAKTSVTIWSETESPIKCVIAKTNRAKDFTTVVAIDGLEADTQYYYEPVVAGKKVAKRRSFRTFPTSGTKCKFKVGFGGGAGYTPQHERMWNTIASHNPAAFLFLGDNVYIDHPEQPEVQQYCYYRRRNRSEFRDFAAATALYAIWDDHDFGDNDSLGGPEIDEPKWKRQVWRVFCDNWNNPYYGGGKSRPGCWFDFSIGDVDFFMLDGRYYRSDPQKDNPSMLGPVQKKWLLKKLKASKATFKVLASPVPWAFGAKSGIQRTRRGMVPGSLDTWEGFKDERAEIFSLIEENKIDGVILISADRHRSDVRKIERENGYAFYEFESSKLTNVHTHSLVPGALFGYNEKCSFWLLTFDTTRPDPQVTFQIINIDNEVIYTLSFNKSRLTHKKEHKSGEGW